MYNGVTEKKKQRFLKKKKLYMKDHFSWDNNVRHAGSPAQASDRHPPGK